MAASNRKSWRRIPHDTPIGERLHSVAQADSTPLDDQTQRPGSLRVLGVDLGAALFARWASSLRFKSRTSPVSSLCVKNANRVMTEERAPIVNNNAMPPPKRSFFRSAA